MNRPPFASQQDTPFEALPERRRQQLMAFNRLLDVMDELRENCPWDRKQTLDSLRHLTIEETYELSDAILQNDLPGLKKELGDVWLHLIFYAKIAAEQGAFDVLDVLTALTDKLVSRHPHIYADAVADTEEQVRQNWEALKLKEGNPSVLAGVPAALPALVKAMRIQEKARGAGFDWERPEQVWEKVREELEEFREVAETTDAERTEDELGDVLFSLVNYARFLNLNPETALERTNRKFISRFTYLEEQARLAGKNLKDMTLAEMDVYWIAAKQVLEE